MTKEKYARRQYCLGLALGVIIGMCFQLFIMWLMSTREGGSVTLQFIISLIFITYWMFSAGFILGVMWCINQYEKKDMTVGQFFGSIFGGWLLLILLISGLEPPHKP